MKKIHVFGALAASLLFAGCSTTKDKWVNRQYHKTTAHYNAYFNGKEAFDEAVSGFEATEKWDFENRLPLYYWPDEKQATSLFAKMDRALEKSAKVIKGHSMVFKGKQKNPYVVKSYLLIARSRFYKHELIQSLEATSYIEDQFDGLEMAEAEVFWSRILAAQTHLRMGNGFQAEGILDEVYTKKLPKDQLHAAEKAYAYFHLEQGDVRQGQEWVAAAAESATKKDEKVRLTYLNAQLLGELNMGYESALAYEEVLKLHPDDYDFTFSAQIKRAENFDVYMEDFTIIEKDLKKMLKDDKNISYRDQIYYVWALKELDLEHYPEAENLLRQSVSSSVNNPRQKGKSYLRLATIEFDFREFVNAQAFYDSAIASLPVGYPGLDTLEERTKVLDELVGLLNDIELQDSLQGMYGMSEEALRDKFTTYIDRKKEREAEAARRAEIAALNAATNAQLADSGPIAGGGSGQWYFYNPTVRAQGLAAFKRTWGDRELEDHWRTKDKPIDGFGTVDLAANEQSDSTAEKKVLPTNDNSVDYYLARVLKDDDDLKLSLRKEATALAELGFVYKDGLKEPNEAESTWLRFMKEFSTSGETPKVLYGQYLLYGSTNSDEDQFKAKNTLLDEHPTSPFAALVRGDELGPKIPVEEQNAYNVAFEAYSAGNTTLARRETDGFKTQYPTSQLMPKVALLEAYLAGASGNVETTVTALKEVLSAYSGTEEAARAGQILAMLLDEQTADEDSQGKGDLKVRKVAFDEQANAPHKVIWVIPAENAKINELRNALADFNKEHFKFDNLRIQNIFYDQNTQLVIVSGLRSKAKAVVYLNTFNEQGVKLRQFYPEDRSAVFFINNPNFGKVYRDKVLKEYLQYFNAL